MRRRRPRDRRYDLGRYQAFFRPSSPERVPYDFVRPAGAGPRSSGRGGRRFVFGHPPDPGDRHPDGPGRDAGARGARGRRRRPSDMPDRTRRRSDRSRCARPAGAKDRPHRPRRRTPKGVTPAGPGQPGEPHEHAEAAAPGGCNSPGGLATHFDLANDGVLPAGFTGLKFDLGLKQCPRLRRLSLTQRLPKRMERSIIAPPAKASRRTP